MNEYTQDQKEAMQRYKRPFIDELNNSDIIQVLGLQKDRKGGRGGYVCPLCHSGTGPNGTGGSVTADHRRFTCWDTSCKMNGDGHGQDVYGALQAITGKSGNEILREHFPSYNIAAALTGTGAARMPETQERPERAQRPTEPLPDYREYYRVCRDRLTEPAALEYLNKRGISPATAAAYWIGYDPAADPANAPGAMGSEYKPFPCPRLIIPFDRAHYMGRSVDPDTPKMAIKMNNRKPEGDTEGLPMFNARALDNTEGRPVFITEGAIDALSIIEAGGLALGLNGVNNVKNKLIPMLEKRKSTPTLILCLDSDDAGRKGTDTLSAALKERNIPFISAQITGQYKDPNEALTGDRAAFVEVVKIAERKTTKPDNVGDYVSVFMADEIRKFRADAERSTGFSNLDEVAGGIYAGLYVVGGISSVGKTSFITQLAEQLAERGQHVLLFSMEQSRLEIVSKGISRRTAAKDPRAGVTSLSIRKGYLPKQALDAADSYTKAVGERLSVIEGNFACTVSYIREYATEYAERNGVKPVIVVDYLQTLKGDIDPATGRRPTDTRQIVDSNIIELKRISRSLETPVFVISSVNRSNYLVPIDFEAFKESGGIEFTADVVWGLQLAAINDDLFNRTDKIKEKREKIKEAKAAIPRDIELVCLKNRYGISNYTANFTYYPQYDLFIETKGAGR